jgi:hypothetical protein
MFINLFLKIEGSFIQVDLESTVDTRNNLKARVNLLKRSLNKIDDTMSSML